MGVRGGGATALRRGRALQLPAPELAAPTDPGSEESGQRGESRRARARPGLRPSRGYLIAALASAFAFSAVSSSMAVVRDLGLSMG